MGPGGERALRLIAADNPAPQRAYAFRRLPSIAGSAAPVLDEDRTSVLTRYESRGERSAGLSRHETGGPGRIHSSALAAATT